VPILRLRKNGIARPCIYFNVTSLALFNKLNMGLRAICKFTDWLVRLRKVYGPKRSWGPYSFRGLTNQSVNLHFARKAMFYLLYYTESKSFHPFVLCFCAVILLLFALKHYFTCSVCEISQALVGFCLIIFKRCSKKSCSSFNIPFLLIKLNI
jgi:hypothetical protein